MDTLRELEKPVARVFRRMRFQRFVTAAVWSWTGALVVVALALGASKLMKESPLPLKASSFVKRSVSPSSDLTTR